MAAELVGRIQAFLEERKINRQLQEQIDKMHRRDKRIRQLCHDAGIINRATPKVVAHFEEYLADTRVQGSPFRFVDVHPTITRLDANISTREWLSANTVYLLWGNKLDPTDLERDIMERLSRERRARLKLKTDPMSPLKCDYNEIFARISGKEITLFSDNHVAPLSIAHFIDNPISIDPLIRRAMKHPIKRFERF